MTRYLLRRCATGPWAALGFLGLSVSAGLGLAQKPQGSANAPLLVAQVSAPATLPGMGKELQRAVLSALKEASVAAQAAKTDADTALSARLEELGAGRFRLSLSYRGASTQSVGDLEHLDDLVYAVVAELRPKLAPEPTPIPPAVPVVSSLVKREPSPLKRDATAKVATTPITTTPITTPPVTTKPTTTTTPTTTTPTTTTPPTLPLTTLPPPTLVPSTTVATGNDSEHKPRQRPRVAVGVMGEPLASLPPGYYGLGVVGQQAMMSFLAQRLQVPVVATRLYSLVGGFEALEQSLRASARHTLMARLDSLTISSGVLTGRVHLVLLQDGKLLYDRSVALPPTVPGTAEPTSATFGRAVSAALELLTSELSGRLALQ